MKTRILIILLLSSMFFSFHIIEKSESNAFKSDLPHYDSTFIIGVLESGAEWRFDRLVDSLGTNLWHRYPDSNDGWITAHNNWEHFDSLNAPFSVYGERIKNVISENQDSGMYTLMNRGNIQSLCFGQRSDYECEKQSMVNQDYWFYTFGNRDNSVSDSNKTGIDTTDNSQFGNGAKVVQCRYGIDQPGYVVKKLKANREQINCIESWGVKASDKNYKWFVKPRIRIDTSIVQQSDTTRVCRINILNFNGETIKTIIIRARNFQNINNPYHGNYNEEFFYQQGDNELIIDPSLNEFFNPDCRNLWDQSCQVDFKIYWYGLCNMWIDYVRVDNEVANDLFKGVYNDANFSKPWLKWEVQDIANQYPEGVYKFYIEEFEANQIPCMTYVNRVIDSLSNHKFSLMCDLNYSTFKIHIPGFDTVKMSAERIKRTLVDKVGSKEIFMGAYAFLSHGLEGGNLNSYIPNTLPVSSYHEPELTGSAVSVTQYENWLQQHIDTNRNEWFDATLYFKYANKIAALADIPFINLIQAHSWFSYSHHLREPLNEEISLLAYLGISYGAKGMLYYEMKGSDSVDNNPCVLFYRGLGEPNSLCNYDHPRYINAYGQKKWKFVSQLNHKIKKIGHHLMNFDNTNSKSFILRLERDNLINETFFSDILSYKQEESDYTEPQTSPESVSQRYLQAAVFNNPNAANSKYFMIVNRRCSPFEPGKPDVESGRRAIQIMLDSNSNSFSGFNIWSIYNLENDSLIITFDKKIISTINLGWYLPGEGKLYKIAPVMQDGGTLDR